MNTLLFFKVLMSSSICSKCKKEAAGETRKQCDACWKKHKVYQAKSRAKKRKTAENAQLVESKPNLPWWIQKQYCKYFMTPENNPLTENNPHAEHYVKCLLGKAEGLCATTFLDYLLMIDSNAIFDHKRKKVVSEKFSDALSWLLYMRFFRYTQFPKIVSITSANQVDPLWIYISLQFPGPGKQTYTFYNMKTLYFLINQFRYEDDDLDDLLDKYIAFHSPNYTSYF